MLLAFFTWIRNAMFHTQHTFITFAVNEFKYIFIVDFSGGRLFSAGVIAYLYISNFFPCIIHPVDNITVIFLHVVNVKQNFTGWAVYSFANFIGLVGGA